MADQGTTADARDAHGGRDGHGGRGGRRRTGSDPDRVARSLKERVYATFTGLAIVLVQLGNADHLSPGNATGTLFVGILAISLAGLVAEVIAHLAAHGAFPSRAEFREMLEIAGTALGSASIPLVLLVLSWVGVLELPLALDIASKLYVLTLAAVAWFAVRRAGLSPWRRIVALALLVALGALVIVVQQLAHGH